MRLLPVTLSGGTYMIRQHDDGTFEMPPELAALEGRNVALKPGQEMWWLVRKPLQGTVSQNVMEHGTGALNIGACRVGSGERTNNAGGSSSLQRVSRVESGYRPTVTTSEGVASEVAGRWPANIVLTHSAACEVIGTKVIRGDSRSGQERGQRPGGFLDIGADGGSERPNGTLHGDQVAEVFACAPDCPVAELDRQSGVLTSGANPSRRGSDGLRDAYGEFAGQQECVVHRGADKGGASRFFHAFRYQAKAPASERPRGEDGNAHVTVKSLGLMRHFVRLICPPGGTVLDLFAGSGPTAEACLVEGFDCILIELEQPSAELIRTRLRKDIQPVMFGAAS